MNFTDLQVGTLYLMMRNQSRNHGVWTVVEYMGGHLFKDYTHGLYEDEMFLRVPEEGTYRDMEPLTDDTLQDILGSTERWLKETEANLALAKRQSAILEKVQL